MYIKKFKVLFLGVNYDVKKVVYYYNTINIVVVVSMQTMTGLWFFMQQVLFSLGQIHLVSVCSGSEGNPEGFPVTIRHRWP